MEKDAETNLQLHPMGFFIKRQRRHCKDIRRYVWPNTKGWARMFELLRSPRIDSKEPIPPRCVAGAVIFKQSMGARNWFRIGFSYRPARLYRLAELIPWNRCLGPLKVSKIGLWWAGTTTYSHSVPRPSTDCLKIPGLFSSPWGEPAASRWRRGASRWGSRPWWSSGSWPPSPQPAGPRFDSPGASGSLSQCWRCSPSKQKMFIFLNLCFLPVCKNVSGITVP